MPFVTELSNWQIRFLRLAEFVSHWSKDPRTKVGAVVARDNRVLGLGFNGFPPSVPDRPEWLEDRETKLKLVIHAEHNALIDAAKKCSVEGACLYLYPCPPCSVCAATIAAYGISAVYAPYGNEEKYTNYRAGGQFVFERSGTRLLLLDDDLTKQIFPGLRSDAS